MLVIKILRSRLRDILTRSFKSPGKPLTAQQQKSIATLQENTAPGLIYVYGEPQRIVVASNTGFMGFDLGTLMTLGQGGAFPPHMFLGGGMSHPSPVPNPTQ